MDWRVGERLPLLIAALPLTIGIRILSMKRTAYFLSLGPSLGPYIVQIIGRE
jgi:hypothetical protein